SCVTAAACSCSRCSQMNRAGTRPRNTRSPPGCTPGSYLMRRGTAAAEPGGTADWFREASDGTAGHQEPVSTRCQRAPQKPLQVLAGGTPAEPARHAAELLPGFRLFETLLRFLARLQGSDAFADLAFFAPGDTQVVVRVRKVRIQRDRLLVILDGTVRIT